MKMSAPRITTWLLATLLAAAGILMRLGILNIAGLNRHAFWFVTAGFGLLFLASLVRSL